MDPLNTQQPPRIVRLSVSKLFGVFDHNVELRRDERVTIIHGINGVGKTKMIELAAALTRGQVGQLAKIPFESFRIEFDDGTATIAKRDATATTASGQKRKGARKANSSIDKIEIHRISVATNQDIAVWSDELPSEEIIRNQIGIPGWLEVAGDGSWFDNRTNEIVSTHEIARRYGFPLNALLRAAERARQQIPIEKRGELIPCQPAHLIETQRLLRIAGRKSPAAYRGQEDGNSLVTTVNQLASELREKISSVQRDFARRTQLSDRTFMERALKATHSGSHLELKTRLEQLEMHRMKLEKVGLLDAATFGPKVAPTDAETLQGDRAAMVALHAADAEEKLKAFDELATPLSLFLDGINEKLAYPKKLALTTEGQLLVQRPNETITLDQLSSGEQHELVLLYDLAFRIVPNTLVMIDEPELSLHPTWQQQFLGDMLAIAKNGSFDVLLATHSPYIIANRNELCVELQAERLA